jgi:hypothetical protein
MLESSLHAALKTWYSKHGGHIEVPVEGYLVDITRGDLLIEIQTRNFSALRKKLNILLENHAVRLVHPIAVDKRIVRMSAIGNIPVSRRKSPKQGCLVDLFDELVHIGYLVPHPNFQVEVVFTHEEEIRRDDGRGSWRRNRVSIVDRRLIDIIRIQTLRYPDDYLSMLPARLTTPFTNNQLAEALKIRISLARKMSYTLRAMGLLTVEGKNGNKLLFQVI